MYKILRKATWRTVILGALMGAMAAGGAASVLAAVRPASACSGTWASGCSGNCSCSDPANPRQGHCVISL
jgi:hypothetical protein